MNNFPSDFVRFWLYQALQSNQNLRQFQFNFFKSLTNDFLSKCAHFSSKEEAKEIGKWWWKKETFFQKRCQKRKRLISVTMYGVMYDEHKRIIMSTYIYFNSNDTKVQVGISEYKIIRSEISNILIPKTHLFWFY